MANVVTIQQKINKGYNIAAKHLGTKFGHFRPQNTGPVLENINLVQEVFLAPDKDSEFGFGQPIGFKADTYFALLDLTLVQIGDYLWDFGNYTFYVVNIEPLKPALLVRCSNTITVYRPASSNGYGGDTGPQTLLTGWPCSVQPGAKGERNVSMLPESVRAPWTTIHLPFFPGTIIRYGDIIVDELGRRFAVSLNEVSAIGYELTCSYASP